MLIQLFFIVLNVTSSIQSSTCPDNNWIQYTDTNSKIAKCYYSYKNSTSNWTDCANKCSQFTGGSMLCPTSVTLSNWMYNNLGEGKRSTWIGYKADNECSKKESYDWVDTCSPKPNENVRNWQYGQPDKSSGCYVYLWDLYKGTWDNQVDNAVGEVYCACELSIPSSTEEPTFSPSSVASTVMIPTAVEPPKCPDGHCNCQWTLDLQKNNDKILSLNDADVVLDNTKSSNK